MYLSADGFKTKTRSWANEFRRNKRLWEAFCSCKSDVQRFRHARSFLEKRNVSLDFSRQWGIKSAARAESYLEEAGRCEVRGDNAAALFFYNVAVHCAPWPERKGRDRGTGSVLLACLEKRSAFLFKFKRYGYCVRDIDFALILGYPLAESKKLLVRKALALLAAGCPDAAVACLQSDAVEMGVCGREYFAARETGDPDEATMKRLLEKAVRCAEERKTRGEPRKPLKMTYPDGGEMKEKLGKISLTGGEHPVFPAASSLVKLEFTRAAGRHFVAASDLSGGEVLLIESPFVGAVTVDGAQQYCDACTVWSEAPFPCNTCNSMKFCSAACALGEEGRLHARECKFIDTIVALQKSAEDDLPLLVTRTLLKKSAEEWREFSKRSPGNLPGEADEFEAPLKEVYASGDYDNVFCLVKKTKKWDPVQVLVNAFLSFAVVSVYERTLGPAARLDDELRDFLGGVALRHFLNFTLNLVKTQHFAAECVSVGCVSVLLRSLHRSGSAVFPTYSLFNFSCDGNVVATFYADRVVVTAGRPVAAGEVLSAFRDESDFRVVKIEERRARQAKEHFYRCRCRACEGNWPLLPALAERALKGRDVVQCPECSKELGFRSGLEERHPKCPRCGFSIAAVARMLHSFECVEHLNNRGGYSMATLKTMRAVYKLPTAGEASCAAHVRLQFLSEGNRRSP